MAAFLKACPSESARPLINAVELALPEALVFSHVALPARLFGQHQVGKAEGTPECGATHPD
jgi:hypothetical protein